MEKREKLALDLGAAKFYLDFFEGWRVVIDDKDFKLGGCAWVRRVADMREVEREDLHDQNAPYYLGFNLALKEETAQALLAAEAELEAEKEKNVPLRHELQAAYNKLAAEIDKKRDWFRKAHHNSVGGTIDYDVEGAQAEVDRLAELSPKTKLWVMLSSGSSTSKIALAKYSAARLLLLGGTIEEAEEFVKNNGGLNDWC
jgi:hypothetical protein